MKATALALGALLVAACGSSENAPGVVSAAPTHGPVATSASPAPTSETVPTAPTSAPEIEVFPPTATAQGGYPASGQFCADFSRPLKAAWFYVRKINEATRNDKAATPDITEHLKEASLSMIWLVREAPQSLRDETFQTGSGFAQIAQNQSDVAPSPDAIQTYCVEHGGDPADFPAALSAG